jgi:hypothetical protein
MTLKAKIIQELDHLPDPLLQQTFDFLLLLKSQPRSAHPPTKLSLDERQKRLNQLFGAWQNQPDLDEIFETIDRERHADRGRNPVSFD